MQLHRGCSWIVKRVGGRRSAYPSCICRLLHTAVVTEHDGVRVVRKESHARTFRGLLDEVDATWEAQQAGHRLYTVAVHTRSTTWGPTWVDNEDAGFVLGMTANRLTAMDGDPSRGPSASSQAVVDTSNERVAARADSQGVVTATCVAVDFDDPSVEIVTFTASDASFPTVPGKNIENVVTKNQPHTIIFAERHFPISEFVQRLETVFHRRHVVGSYCRSAHGLPGSTFVIPSPADGPPNPGAVGIMLFGDISSKQMACIARGVLGNAYYGDFCLDAQLTRHLFVPTSFKLGKQRACTAYLDYEASATVDLPVFRGPVVLYPGCSVMLKIFEPRYRTMVKHCLEKREPLGILHVDHDVGTLAYISELHDMQDDGISKIKLVGTRRFCVKESRISPDSFGLSCASVSFFDEEKVADAAEKEELERLTVLVAE